MLVKEMLHRNLKTGISILISAEIGNGVSSVSTNMSSMADGTKLSYHEEERIRNIERNHAQMLMLGLFGTPKLPDETSKNITPVEGETLSCSSNLCSTATDSRSNSIFQHTAVFSFCAQHYTAEDALRQVQSEILEREDSVRIISSFLDKVVTSAPGMYVCGLPGSGKSLICKRLVENHPVPSVVISCGQYATMTQFVRGVWASVVNRVALEIYTAGVTAARLNGNAHADSSSGCTNSDSSGTTSQVRTRVPSIGAISALMQQTAAATTTATATPANCSAVASGTSSSTTSSTSVTTGAASNGASAQHQFLAHFPQHSVIQAYLTSRPPKDLFTLLKMLTDLFKYYYSLINESEVRRQWLQYKNERQKEKEKERVPESQCPVVPTGEGKPVSIRAPTSKFATPESNPAKRVKLPMPRAATTTTTAVSHIMSENVHHSRSSDVTNNTSVAPAEFRAVSYSHCIFHLLLDDVSLVDNYSSSNKSGSGNAGLILMQLSQKCHPLVKVLGTSVTASNAQSSSFGMVKTVHCLPPYSDESYRRILVTTARRNNRWIELIHISQQHQLCKPTTDAGEAVADKVSNSDSTSALTAATDTATNAALNELLDFLLQNAYPVLAMNTRHVGVMIAMAYRMWKNVADFLNSDAASRSVIESMCASIATQTRTVIDNRGGSNDSLIDTAAPAIMRPWSSCISQLKKTLTRNQVLDKIIQYGVQGPCAASIREGQSDPGEERINVELPTGAGQPPKSLLLAQEFSSLRKSDLREQNWVERLTAAQKFLIIACYRASRCEDRSKNVLAKGSGKRSLTKLRNAELKQSEYQDEDDVQSNRRSSTFDGSFAFDIEALANAYIVLLDCCTEEEEHGAEYKILSGESNFFGMVSTLVHQLGVITAVPTTQPRSYDINHIDLDCRSRSICSASNAVMYKCNIRKEVVFEIAASLNVPRTMVDDR